MKSVNLIISALSCISVILFSCSQKQQPQQIGGYKTMAVSTADRTVQSSYSAKIQGKQDVDIMPQVSGQITDICIKEGSKVKKGQTLFIIDQAPYKAALATAEANVKSAEASVATAKMTEESKEELHADNIVSDFDMQDAKNSLQEAQASLEQAKAEQANAANNLSYTVVKSPVNGTAGMIPYRIGAYVTPQITTPLLSVSDNDEMYVYFSLTESQMLYMAEQYGSLDSMLVAMPEVQLKLSDGKIYSEKGRIDAVSGIIDKATGTISVRAVFPNKKHILLSGGSGTVLLPSEMKDCIVIPQAATYEIQDKIFVYKIVDGRTKSTLITVYPISDGHEYIVESGLEVGDVIISEGAGLVREGIEVSASPADTTESKSEE
jgi:membrane fusion protein (multidrug efflux system)